MYAFANTLHMQRLPHVDNPPAQLHDPSCLLFRTGNRAKSSFTFRKPEEEQLVQMLKFW